MKKLVVLGIAAAVILSVGIHVSASDIKVTPEEVVSARAAGHHEGHLHDQGGWHHWPGNAGGNCNVVDGYCTSWNGSGSVCGACSNPVYCGEVQSARTTDEPVVTVAETVNCNVVGGYCTSWSGSGDVCGNCNNPVHHEENQVNCNVVDGYCTSWSGSGDVCGNCNNPVHHEENRVNCNIVDGYCTSGSGDWCGNCNNPVYRENSGGGRHHGSGHHGGCRR